VGSKYATRKGQSLAYIYSRETPSDAHMAKVLTEDEPRRLTAIGPQRSNDKKGADRSRRPLYRASQG
jgi:hypothetical protein